MARYIPSIVSVTIMTTAIFGAVSTSALGQIRPPLYDETKVPKFELVSVLQNAQGNKIESVNDWPKQRTYLVDQLAKHVYGQLPSDAVTISTKLIEQGAFGGTRTTNTAITRKQLEVTLARNGKSVVIDFMVFLPADAKSPVPCFVGLNFNGNQSTCDDPAVRLTRSWCDKRGVGVVDNKATEASRGDQSHRWPIEAIVGRGYAVATAHYADIDPDFDDEFVNGVHALYPDFKPGDANPDRWGSIGAWAWGLSRLADVLEKDPAINSKELMVIGHSRLGKTALWAGATDQRFQIVYSNNSGCGGAALSKRCFGESVARINTSFPHWFCRNFRQYNDREELLPVDQHMLIAAIAPRPAYIASATEDQWADPKGELHGGVFASPAYELHGLKGVYNQELPAPDTVIGAEIGYHLRTGKHDLTPWDWDRYMDFADVKLQKKSTARN